MFDFGQLEELSPVEGCTLEACNWQPMKLAALNCKVLRPSEAVKLAVIFFHGSGEPWRIEQEHLFSQLRVTSLREAGICIVLPASPLSDGGLHFWYSADSTAIADLLMKIKEDRPCFSETPVLEEHMSALDLLKDGEPSYLDASRSSALSLVQAVETNFGVPCARIVLGGFSQGAAVAMDCALHLLPKVPAALGLFSGSLMCRRRWRELFETYGQQAKDPWVNLPLLQGHGSGDIAVGVNGGRWLHSFCKDEIGMSCAVYEEFRGGHTIPPELADKFVDMILGVATEKDRTILRQCNRRS